MGVGRREFLPTPPSMLRIGYVPEHFSSPLLELASTDDSFTLVPCPAGTGEMIARLTANEIDLSMYVHYPPQTHIHSLIHPHSPVIVKCLDGESDRRDRQGIQGVQDDRQLRQLSPQLVSPTLLSIPSHLLTHFAIYNTGPSSPDSTHPSTRSPMFEDRNVGFPESGVGPR